MTVDSNSGPASEPDWGYSGGVGFTEPRSMLKNTIKLTPNRIGASSESRLSMYVAMTSDQVSAISRQGRTNLTPRPPLRAGEGESWLSTIVLTVPPFPRAGERGVGGIEVQPSSPDT